MSWGKQKSYRNININGEIWRWKVGSTHVSIRGPNKESYAPYLSEVGSGCEEDYNFAIYPAEIRAYIIKVAGNLDPIPELKDSFYKREFHCESGDSLNIVINGQNQMFNVGDGKNDDERCWIALNYIKYKYGGRFYETAIEIVSRNLKYKKQLTLALLKASK